MKMNKKFYMTFLMAGLISSTQVSASEVPDMIRIGLESIAKDKTSITIKSEEAIEMGYYDDNRWHEEAVLDTEAITISLTTSRYYTDYEIYTSYEKASNQAGRNDIVAYAAPGEYMLYTEEDAGDVERIPSSSKRLMVKNDKSETVLIYEDTETPLSFKGAFDDYHFPATKVGSERLYRGAIEIIPGQYSGVTAVNHLQMEEYLYGVIRNEIGFGSHEEALKAQAVAARSIATFQYDRYIGRGYNLVDTTATQVYKGITSEHERTTAAVDDTANEIALYNGQVAETVYNASSGGYTANSENVWGGNVPYLSAVYDPYEINNNDWTRTITLEEVEDCLYRNGLDIGRVEGVEIKGWTESGRVEELVILGTEEDYTVRKDSVRYFFNASNEGSLKSTMFKFTPYDEQDEIILEESENNESKGVAFDEVYVLTDNSNEKLELDGLQAQGSDDRIHLSEEDAIYILTQSGIVGGEETTSTPDVPVFDVADEPLIMRGDFTLYGKGFGHGVGMSQNGAIAMADAGFDYEEILTFYFTGVEISS